ncbi:hypothetical protein HOK51_01325 [Candidatus Woesearchaeota archaeon]|jgi:hypothetical protein|nr:hypothetical protein [Candidatus Woesearchaeota archaeon]MBT6518455.1 hypothetical protein [Candidatus Woesearchaeota archaeon]MBT7367043.1 hypothetical protein [Candidatus Woesearchaeota archaeon]
MKKRVGILKRIIVFLSLILLLTSLVNAGRTGDSCNYLIDGDSECDALNNIYCINNICTVYLDSTEEYCSDPDGNDPNTQTTISYLFRTDTGAFVEGSSEDTCLDNLVIIDECESCQVEEYICDDTQIEKYNKNVFDCDSCETGKCVEYEESQADEEEQEAEETNNTVACNYLKYKDNECEYEENLYCINNICNYLDESPESYCADTDKGINTSVKGKLDYSYRTETGKILSNETWDKCIGTDLNELSCLPKIPFVGPNYELSEINCEGGCVNGICMLVVEQTEEMNDQILLQAVQDWSEGKLGETEEDNDSAIQEIIELWKQES